jgi:DNA-binding CsgD family transcriptional regulator
MDGQRFDRWTQRLARRLGPCEGAEHKPPRSVNDPASRATIAPAADGTCLYPDLTTAELGGAAICGWPHPPALAAGGQPVLAPARNGATASTPRLSPREQEVAALIGRGLKDREIAAALVVSERTVHAHVHNLLAKLDLTSRRQVATWAREHGLLSGAATRRRRMAAPRLTPAGRRLQVRVEGT